MQRIYVTGICGAGKTTLARAISRKCGFPHHELDALFHGPNWAKRPQFEEDVRSFIDDPQWVCEGEYHRFLGDLLWEHADTVVWLDMPRRTVMWRVVRRSLTRVILRRKMWNGNRETWCALLFDPKHPVHWAWSQYEVRRRHVAALATRHPRVRVVRLISARQARSWLRDRASADTVAEER